MTLLISAKSTGVGAAVMRTGAGDLVERSLYLAVCGDRLLGVEREALAPGEEGGEASA